MKLILALINCYLSFIIDYNQVRLAVRLVVRDAWKVERHEVEFNFSIENLVYDCSHKITNTEKT